MDKRTEFASAVAMAGGTGYQLVGDVIDLENVRDIGNSFPAWLVIQCTTAFGSAGAADVQFILASDAAAAIATDGSATEHLASPTLNFDDFTAGDMIFQGIIPIESAASVYERYVGILCNVTTAALNAGAINAFITLQPPVHKLYPNGVQ